MAFDSRLLSGLSVVAAVVDAGSFVRAADALGLTQSGVSRAVARLEHRIGVRLFDRTSRTVTLTDEGRRFYEQVAPLLTGIEDAATMAAGASTAVHGRLRVNVDPYFSKLVLAPRLGEFLTAHPALSLELTTRDRLGDLVADGFDVALRFGEPEPSTLIVRLLLKTRVLTCASPTYIERHGRPRKPADLGATEHECILFRDSVTGRPFPWEFHRRQKVVSIPVSGRLIVNDPFTLLAACEAGVGVAQAFELGIGELLRSGVLVQLLPGWAEEQFPLYAYHLSRHVPPAKVRAFLDFVVSIVRPRAVTRGAPFEA
jgi:DNA-binding transcriptional LysR family regulator